MSIFPISLNVATVDVVTDDKFVCVTETTNSPDTMVLKVYTYNGQIVTNVGIGSIMMMNFSYYYVKIVGGVPNDSGFRIVDIYGNGDTRIDIGLGIPIASVDDDGQQWGYVGTIVNGDPTIPTVYKYNLSDNTLVSFGPVGTNTYCNTRVQYYNNRVYYNDGASSYYQYIRSVDQDGQNTINVVIAYYYKDFKIYNGILYILNVFGDISCYNVQTDTSQQFDPTYVSSIGSPIGAAYTQNQGYMVYADPKGNVFMNTFRITLPSLITLPYRYSSSFNELPIYLYFQDYPYFDISNSKNLMVALEYINLQSNRIEYEPFSITITCQSFANFNTFDGKNSTNDGLLYRGPYVKTGDFIQLPINTNISSNTIGCPVPYLTNAYQLNINIIVTDKDGNNYAYDSSYGEITLVFYNYKE
jgi:hypothetical protein